MLWRKARRYHTIAPRSALRLSIFLCCTYSAHATKQRYRAACFDSLSMCRRRFLHRTVVWTFSCHTFSKARVLCLRKSAAARRRFTTSTRRDCIANVHRIHMARFKLAKLIRILPYSQIQHLQQVLNPENLVATLPSYFLNVQEDEKIMSMKWMNL